MTDHHRTVRPRRPLARYGVRLVGLGLSLIATAGAVSAQEAADLRSVYDVQAYRIDVTVDARHSQLQGRVAIDVIVKEPGTRKIEFDVGPGVEVQGARVSSAELHATRKLGGKRLLHLRDDDRVRVDTGQNWEVDQRFLVLIDFVARPHPTTSLMHGTMPGQGLHFGVDKRNMPRVDVSCQTIGSQCWFPCKSSMDHPEDKPDRVYVNVTVPSPLKAVSVGRLAHKVDIEDPSSGLRSHHRYHWQLDAPTPCWAIGMHVGDFAYNSCAIPLPRMTGSLEIQTYVLPEHAESLHEQFARIPDVLSFFAETFGEYPYPGYKLALVDTQTLSATGATVLGFRDAFPVWRRNHAAGSKSDQATAALDRLVCHEVAHCWWGQGLTAHSWEDAWLHESFSTYSEILFEEHQFGPEAAQKLLDHLRDEVSAKDRVWPGERAGRTYTRTRRNQSLWTKGPWILHMLRHQIDDDEVFFGAVREFYTQTRLGFATTRDLVEILERHTSKDWLPFFEAWFRGRGLPDVRGELVPRKDGVFLSIENASEKGIGFQIPLDLSWSVSNCEEPVHKRVWLTPGTNEFKVEWGQLALPGTLDWTIANTLGYFEDIRVRR